MTEIITFGCRLNALESEVIKSRAAEAGLEGAVIVNSCAVTAEAVRQARQAIRKARREAPGRRVVVTGCAAQIDPGEFAAMPDAVCLCGAWNQQFAREPHAQAHSATGGYHGLHFLGSGSGVA
jgi:threonylcarbamoyladenosine tRNA methylthiotransferase MtaB